jgi:hypothetical protein
MLILNGLERSHRAEVRSQKSEVRRTSTFQAFDFEVGSVGLLRCADLEFLLFFVQISSIFGRPM